MKLLTFHYLIHRDIVETLDFHNGNYNYLWIGLEKVGGVWTYINGSIPDNDDVHWKPGEPRPDEDVALIYAYEDSFYDLLTATITRTSSSSYWHALCEYHCI